MNRGRLRSMHLALFGLLLAGSACDAPGSGAAAPLDVPGDARDAEVGSESHDAEVGSDSQDASPAPDTAAPAVCTRWLADRAERTEGPWSGSVASCDPGDLGEPGRTDTLIQVNLYRSLAALPPVALSGEKSAAAQACALVIHANRALEHQIPQTWECFSELAAEGASLSNIATVPAVAAVDLYMTDEHVETLGHRRWVLSNSLGPIGVGSTSDYSCMHVILGDGHAGARWTAWPPPGEVPIQALRPATGLDTDAAGWSIQSDFIDLRGAAVRVSRDGEALATDVWPLAEGYGSTFGLGIRPAGWKTEVGATYRVAVTGLVEGIDYTFTAVDCR